MDSHKREERERAKTFCPNPTDRVGKGGHHHQTPNSRPIGNQKWDKKTGPGLTFGVIFLQVFVSREFQWGVSDLKEMTTQLF